MPTTRLDALTAAIRTDHRATAGSLLGAAPAGPTQRFRQVPMRPADLLLDGLTRLLQEGRQAAAPSLRRAIDMLNRDEDAPWLEAGFFAALALWDDAALAGLGARRVQLARRDGAFPVLARALADLGVTQVLLGRFVVAEACFEEARTIEPSPGDKGAGDVAAGLVLLAAWRGREADVLSLATVGRQDPAAHRIGMESGLTRRAVALVEISHGHYEAAFRTADEAAACDGDNSFAAWSILPELAEAAVRSGEPASAAVAVRRLARLAGDTNWARGVLARSRALLATGNEAETLYLEASACLERSRLLPEFARAKLVHGEWLRRQRRQRDARQQLQAAYELFVSIEANGFAERARAELLAGGANDIRHAGDVLSDLTPREIQIARLIADGASNPEIAAQLFISRRTVEYHLSAIYLKLGVSSRTRLMRQLLEHGLFSQRTA